MEPFSTCCWLLQVTQILRNCSGHQASCNIPAWVRVAFNPALKNHPWDLGPVWLSALACLGSAPWLSVCAGLGGEQGKQNCMAQRAVLGSAPSLSMWVCFVPLKHSAISPLWRQLGHLMLSLALKTVILRGNTDAVFLVWHQAELFWTELANSASCCSCITSQTQRSVKGESYLYQDLDFLGVGVLNTVSS